MFTLHAIAAEARELVRVHYWNTDGCVTDAVGAARLIEHLADEWALVATIRAAGPGAVNGFGSYSVGDARTATVHRSRPLDYLIDLEPDFRARLKRWRMWALDAAGRRV